MKPAKGKVVCRTLPDFDWTDLHAHPRIAQILASRGIRSAEELETSLSSLLAAGDLGGIDAALSLLEASIREQRCIVIVGDYDADGATSTAVAIRLLRAMGAQRVHYFVPDRFRYGYGLGVGVVESLLRLNPDLLITVDNGIASVDGVQHARDRGIDVLITDHHLPPEQLPNASAIVNPNLPGDKFGSKNLAGVGVIFYLLSALRTRFKANGWFDGMALPIPNTADFLDIVALGTVADVVPLDRNNRVLVEQGLRRIRAGRTTPGIAALFEVSGRDQGTAVASDLAFAIAPRLNAAGRLEDMSLGIACLLSDDALEAGELAVKLDSLNRERRAIEADMKEQAGEFLQAWLDKNSDLALPHGLCLFDPQWHEGVIGILAGRVRESVHRPTVIFTNDEQGVLKGSARSIEGVHIRDAIASVDVRHPGLIARFGGHAMAAGLTLEQSALETFAAAFADSVAEQIGGNAMEQHVETDGELGGDDFSLEFAELLRYAAPWGQRFAEPLFEGAFAVLQRRIVGQNHLKLTVEPLSAPGHPIDAIAFNETGENLADGPVHLVYKLDVNEFRGRRSLQLLIDHIDNVTA